VLPAKTLLVEQPEDTVELTGHWVNNLPATTPIADLVRWGWWRIEHDYRELKHGVACATWKAAPQAEPAPGADEALLSARRRERLLLEPVLESHGAAGAGAAREQATAVHAAGEVDRHHRAPAGTAYGDQAPGHIQKGFLLRAGEFGSHPETAWQALAHEVGEHPVYHFSVGEANRCALSSAIRVEGPFSVSF
jgi:hypothetical protein